MNNDSILQNAGMNGEVVIVTNGFIMKASESEEPFYSNSFYISDLYSLLLEKSCKPIKNIYSLVDFYSLSDKEKIIDFILFLFDEPSYVNAEYRFMIDKLYSIRNEILKDNRGFLKKAILSLMKELFVKDTDLLINKFYLYGHSSQRGRLKIAQLASLGQLYLLVENGTLSKKTIAEWREKNNTLYNSIIYSNYRDVIFFNFAFESIKNRLNFLDEDSLLSQKDSFVKRQYLIDVIYELYYRFNQKLF